MSEPGAGRTNRLAGETSPYLLQHAHNPVDWYPWGADALAKARAEARPIFLSIGYAACHWCHVMERESFEDPATAEQLNRDFVAIKVDREERPDLDQVYMTAVQAMTGGGGWPMSVFLTPAGRPFYGGTYFPPEPRHGLPSFRQVLAGVRRAWDEQRDEVEQAGSRLIEAILEQQRMATLPDAGAVEPASAELLAAAAARIEATFDAATGGWGGAPKFPQPMTIELLLRRALSGDERSLAVARRSLDAMADGGIHDQVGGGFHRYATDARWLVPHFEKMLYDNALLARSYVHAWQLTGDRRYRDVALDTLDYLAGEMRTDEGAFAASQDADTLGVEGATFTWTLPELRVALDADDVGLAAAAFGASAGGNWEGTNVLSRVATDERLAARFGIPPTEVGARLAVVRARLRAVRAGRPQPGRDDKALASWNGLAIAAFADAAVAFDAAGDDAIAARLRDVASAAAKVIVARLVDRETGRVGRSWRAGKATGAGVLEDHADLADGLLALYEATRDERWFVTGRRIADAILERFADPAGGWFDTPDDAEGLVVRPKAVQDNAVPSGGAMAAIVMLRLSAWTGEPSYREAAELAIGAVAPFLARHPTAFGQWLVAADLALRPPVEVAIVGDPADPAVRSLLGPAVAGFRPRQVLAVGDPATSPVPLLRGRFALGGRPTAFVCREFACRQPVVEPEALAALLADA